VSKKSLMARNCSIFLNSFLRKIKAFISGQPSRKVACDTFFDTLSDMASSGQRVWADRGSYASYVGRWSRLIAKEFLSWLDVPSGNQWLDVGCGMGALSETILAIAHPSWIQGIDPSEGYLAHARARITDERMCFVSGAS